MKLVGNNLAQLVSVRLVIHCCHLQTQLVAHRSEPSGWQNKPTITSRKEPIRRKLPLACRWLKDCYTVVYLFISLLLRSIHCCCCWVVDGRTYSSKDEEQDLNLDQDQDQDQDLDLDLDQNQDLAGAAFNVNIVLQIQKTTE